MSDRPPARQRLSAVDLAWWRMERPTNPMTITAVMTFADALPFGALVELVEREFLTRDRFRQRVVEGLVGRAFWERVPSLAAAEFVHRVDLPPGAGRAELEALVSRLMSEPLPADRPHWQCHLVERFQGGSALVIRVHHCIADGISLVQLLLSLTEPAHPAHPARTRRRGVEAPPAGPVRYEPEVDVPDLPDGGDVRAAARALARPSAPESRRESRARERLATALKLGGGVVASLGRLADLRADPRTALRGALGVTKRAAWSDPLPLEEVRALGRATGGTINDVLLSAVAGALGRYLAGRGDHIAGAQLRAVVPVNLRDVEDIALGNRFGLVFLPLPVGEPDPVARVAATKRNMDALKRSPEAMVIFGLMRALGNTAAGLLVSAVKLLARRASAVMTNVPGPPARLRLAGATVDGLMFWVPQSGNLGLGVSVLSYAGQVRIGVAADAQLVPDPGAIVAAFHAALDELAAAVHGAEPAAAHQ